MDTINTRRSPILDLPDEILVGILKSIDDIRNLPCMLHAHEKFHDVFTSHRGIGETIIRRQIPQQLLPLAIVNVEASHKTYTHRDKEAVKDLYLAVFETPTRFTDRLEVSSSTNPIPFDDLVRMGRLYDLISKITNQYMKAAWEGQNGFLFRTGRSLTEDPLMMSETEQLRVCRAFYRLNLFFKLCKGDGPPGPSFLQSRSFFFLLFHPPWELGQMACAYNLMEHLYGYLGIKRPKPNTIDVSIEDPLARYDPRLRWVDILISQGLEFAFSVAKYGCREEFALSVMKMKYVFFREMYFNTLRASRLFSPWYRTLDSEPQLPNTPYDDQDEGPATMWLTCHWDGRKTVFIDLEGIDDIQQGAYLF